MPPPQPPPYTHTPRCQCHGCEVPCTIMTFARGPRPPRALPSPMCIAFLTLPTVALAQPTARGLPPARCTCAPPARGLTHSQTARSLPSLHHTCTYHYKVTRTRRSTLSPLVRGAPHPRIAAGSPLVLTANASLCVVDPGAGLYPLTLGPCSGAGVVPWSHTATSGGFGCVCAHAPSAQANDGTSALLSLCTCVFTPPPSPLTLAYHSLRRLWLTSHSLLPCSLPPCSLLPPCCLRTLHRSLLMPLSISSSRLWLTAALCCRFPTPLLHSLTSPSTFINPMWLDTLCRAAEVVNGVTGDCMDVRKSDNAVGTWCVLLTFMHTVVAKLSLPSLLERPHNYVWSLRAPCALGDAGNAVAGRTFCSLTSSGTWTRSPACWCRCRTVCA